MALKFSERLGNFHKKIIFGKINFQYEKHIHRLYFRT